MKLQGKTPEITFHPDVVKEVKFSYNWYQNQAEGLGEAKTGKLLRGMMRIFPFRVF